MTSNKQYIVCLLFAKKWYYYSTIYSIEVHDIYLENNLSKIEKLIAKFYKKPVPNDITIEELKKIARHYGCEIDGGGKHPIHIVYKKLGIVISIPKHGNTVKEAYIVETKKLFDTIEEEQK